MSAVGASSHRLRSWAVTVVVLLSTLLSGLLPTSMAWPGSQLVCADVAVTVAVNPDHAPTADLLHYRIIAGHTHGPPVAINGPAPNGHTYYVLAGETPVLVHNTGGGSGCNLWSGDGWQHVLHDHVNGSPGVSPGKTTFSDYLELDDIGGLIEDAARTPGRANYPDPLTGLPRDGTIHTLDVGYPIGSRGENVIEVILNPDGSLRTAYPR